MTCAIHGGYADRQLVSGSVGVIPTAAVANTVVTGVNSDGSLITGKVESSGTFTPTLTVATPGDLSVTYATRAGRYVITENKCFVNVQIATSAFTYTTASGLWRVSGLPFTAASNSQQSPGSIVFQGIIKSGYTQITPEVDAGSSFIFFYTSSQNANLSTVSSANILSASAVILNISLEYLII